MASEDTPRIELSAPLVRPVTCDVTSFSWVYTPSASSTSNPLMVLAINPVKSTQDGDGTVPPPEGSDSNNMITLSTNLDPTSNRYVWPKVLVPAGGYYLSARLTGADAIYNVSTLFDVAQGPDISCLSSGGSSTGGPGTSYSTAINSPSQTGTGSSSSTATTSSHSSSSSGSSATGNPQSDSASSHSGVNKGAIAGGVVAAVFVLAFVLLTYLFLVRRSKHRDYSRRAQQGYTTSHSNAGLDGDDKFGSTGSKRRQNTSSKWVGLGSVDLQHTTANDVAASNGPSNTTTNHRYSGAVGMTALSRIPGSPNFDADVKPPLDDSTSDLEHGTSSLGHTGIQDAGYFGRQSTDRDRAASQPTPSTHPSSPTSPNRASFHASTTPDSQGPLSSRKKAARKPVPAYAGNPSTETYSTFNTTTTSTSPEPSATIGTTGHGTSQASLPSQLSSSASHGAAAPQMDRQLSGMGMGGKELHYLIPDMPVGYHPNGANRRR